MTVALEEQRSTLSVRGGPAPMRPAHVLAAGALLLMHGIVAWLIRSPAITTRQDDAMYLLLARSLRTGGYNEIFSVEAPIHNMYPPGYPAMLALWGLPGEGYDWMVLLSVLCSVASLLFTFLAVRNIASTGLALVCLLGLSLNFGLLSYGGSIGSEAPYTAFAALALYLFTRKERTARALAAICGLAILAAMTRSIGVTLIAAVGLHLLLERRWKAFAGLSVASLLTVGAWLAWTVLAPHQFAGRSYVADAVQLASEGESVGQALWMRIVHRVPMFVGQTVPWTVGFPGTGATILDNLFAAAVVATGGIAGLLHFLRRWRPAALYLLLYFALLVIWTWSAQRFLIPIVPLIAAAILIGIAHVAALVHRRAGLWAAGIIALLLAATGASAAAEALALKSPCRTADDLPPVACMRLDQISYFNAIRYIRRELPEDAVFFSMKPEPLYLYTGRKTVHPRVALARGDVFLEHLRERGAEYILLGSLQAAERRTVPETLLPFCRRLDPEMFFPTRTYLFRVRSPGEPDATDGCLALEYLMRANENRDFATDP